MCESDEPCKWQDPMFLSGYDAGVLNASAAIGREIEHQTLRGKWSLVPGLQRAYEEVLGLESRDREEAHGTLP